MVQLGILTTCQRCGSTHFEETGIFKYAHENEETITTSPEGWSNKNGMDLCPRCTEIYETWSHDFFYGYPQSNESKYRDDEGRPMYPDGGRFA